MKQNEDQACYLTTFLDAAERMYGRVDKALKRAGLSYAKYDVLNHLRVANQPLTLSELAATQGCAASNITQMVDRLEVDGYVRRVDDVEDRRSIRAELTPAGSAMAEEAQIQMDVVRAEFAAAFTAAERAELSRLLAKID